MLQCYKIFQINAIIWTIYSIKNPENKIVTKVSTKIWSSTTAVNIDNNQKCFLSSKLKGLLKDHPAPRAEPILDFWGPYEKLCRPGGGGSSGYEWNAFVRVSLRLESRSQKALEKQSLPQKGRQHHITIN